MEPLHGYGKQDSIPDQIRVSQSKGHLITAASSAVELRSTPGDTVATADLGWAKTRLGAMNAMMSP